MRLSLIFLVVLAASMLVTSLAAWGITYGTAYGRVTTMSSEFAALSHGALADLSAFVTELLQSNANLVNSLLQQERVTGQERTAQTKAGMLQIIGTLVNYSTNATVQSQQEMDGVVDTFADLMGTVVDQFRNLTTGYAAQLRAALAAKISDIITGQASQRLTALDGLWATQDLGLLGLGRTPYDPIDQEDCMALAIVCTASKQAGDQDILTLILSSGRSYVCTGSYAWISVRSQNGSSYNEDLVTWLAYNASVPTSARKTVIQRCMQDPPNVVQRVGQSCPLPQSCQCGDDQRCTSWYRAHANDTEPRLLGGVTHDASGALAISLSISLFNSSFPTPAAVAGIVLSFGAIDGILAVLVPSSTPVMAVVFNDTQLTVVGSLSRRCAANETPPGDAQLPPESVLRSCDPGLLWAGQWLAQNLATTQAWVTLQFMGMVWDIFPMVIPGAFGYFVIIGTLLSEINGPVDAANALATGQLSTVRRQQLTQVAVSGQAARAYMAEVGAQSIADTHAMEAVYLAQLESVENTSRAALNTSQRSSTEHVIQLTAQQTAQIDALKAQNLAAMSVTAGWTVAVVFAILVVVLLFGAWGTIKITLSLLAIIGLMEDVADMKVENLEVPLSSGVTEVARIQTAFHVLITRLAEYKSYIPAGLFDKQEQETVHGDDASLGGGALDVDSESEEFSANRLPGIVLPRPSPPKRSPRLSGRQRVCSMSVRQVSEGSTESSRGARDLAHPLGRRSTRKNASVLAVNFMGFMEVLANPNDAFSSNILNDYVSLVHEAASQNRGNIDCILGDQILVTFNAHIPCSDSCGAALTSALDIRSKLLKSGQRIQLQMGVSFGTVFASSVGYAKFKSMVTVGSPMKVASLLAHMSAVESGIVIIDSAVEERSRFAYKLSPVELVHIPHLKSFDTTTPKSQPVYMMCGKTDFQEDEWMYQLQDIKSSVSMDWQQVFAYLVAAASMPEQKIILQRFLESQPQDKVAMRLRDRLLLWTPGLGIPI